MNLSELTSQQQQALEHIQRVYAELSLKKSNVVKEVLPTNENLYHWKHYPHPNPINKAEKAKYYYHSHPSHDEERLAEHGHFHIFLRKKAFAEHAEIIVRSQKNLKDASRDNVVHLVAIAMNVYGFPVALFTLNHWVVKGLWYKADDIMVALQNFSAKKPQYELTSDWIAAMVQLFEPHIAVLLRRRDEVIADFQRQHPHKNAWEAKELELTSLCRL
jgi:hypothetical protein